MKIAIICQPFEEVCAPVQSAIPLVTYELARRLAKTNRVVVFSRRVRAQAPTEIDEGGIQYHRVNVLHRLYRGLDKLSGFYNTESPFFDSKLYYLGYVQKIARYLRQEKFDIIHIHNLSQFVPVIKSLNPNARIILHMHCEWLTQLDEKTIAERLRNVDLVLGCSDYVTQRIRAKFPEISRRCRTLYNGVNVDEFAIEKKRGDANDNGIKRLLFVGRMSPEKGIHVLIDAFQTVRKRYPGCRLDLIGPGGLLPYVFVVGISKDKRTCDLGSFYGSNLIDKIREQVIRRQTGYISDLLDRVPTDVVPDITYHGRLPHDAVCGHYREADVFVFPSVCHESFGMPIVEAMAAGRPVVATVAGGIPEIVEAGKTGCLVPRDDANALAEAIQCLLENEQLRKSMGASGRERVLKTFTWDIISEILSGEYEHLLSCKPIG